MDSLSYTVGFRFNAVCCRHLYRPHRMTTFYTEIVHLLLECSETERTLNERDLGRAVVEASHLTDPRYLGTLSVTSNLHSALSPLQHTNPERYVKSSFSPFRPQHATLECLLRLWCVDTRYPREYLVESLSPFMSPTRASFCSILFAIPRRGCY